MGRSFGGGGRRQSRSEYREELTKFYTKYGMEDVSMNHMPELRQEHMPEPLDLPRTNFQGGGHE
jgi:hypothetical protein